MLRNFLFIHAVGRCMIHIYKGDGKGKTTASIGLAVRAAASGKRVLFFQFLKSDTGGERKVLSGIPGITIINIGEEIPFLFNATDDEKLYYKKIYKEKLAMISSVAELYDMFVFDEAVCAVECGVAEAGDLLLFSEFGELVLTGRGNVPELEENADYITCMTKLKHPYDSGTEARCGIEY